MVGPARKREAVATVCQRLEVSERRACRTLGQPRSSQRYQASPRDDDARLTAAIRRIAAREPRAGCRSVRRHLARAGYTIGHGVHNRTGLLTSAVLSFPRPCACCAVSAPAPMGHNRTGDTIGHAGDRGHNRTDHCKRLTGSSSRPRRLRACRNRTCRNRTGLFRARYRALAIGQTSQHAELAA